MSAKTILSRGHQTLRQFVALHGFQSGSLARNWPELAELDARQLRDIGWPPESVERQAAPTAAQGIIGAPAEAGTGTPQPQPTRTATKPAAVALAIGLGLSAFGAAPQPDKTEADIVRSVLPSVVNLTVLKSDQDAAKPGEAKKLAQYYGSGFVVDRSGLILTNRHVIDGAAAIGVTLADGTHARAELCAISGQVDLAVVKVRGRTDLTAAKWGDSENLHMGDRVLAIGNPMGVGVSVSSGVVSALHRHVSANPFDDFVQTDAAINHGNSGGMLVDGAGRVVGVNTAFLSDHANGGSVGLGFAIPASEAAATVRRLRDCNPDPSGWIGVSLQQVTPEIAPAFGLAQATGSVVTAVAANSPAQLAGLREGDVLESLAEVPAPTPVQMLRQIAATPVGTAAPVSYWRQGHVARASVTIAPWPDQHSPQAGKAQSAAMRASTTPQGLGLELADEHAASGASRVVVRSIDPAIAVADAGLQQGDVVLRIAQTTAASAETVREALRSQAEAGRSSVLLLVETGQTRRWIAMPLG